MALRTLALEESGWLHPSHQLSMRTAIIAVALLTLGVAWAWALSPLPEARGIAGYLPLHMLLETVAVVIAMLVYVVGWNGYRRGLPGNILLLACAFLGVGILDFTHTISYPGMPDFVTPSSPEKEIDFWLAARTLASIALFSVAVTPWRPLAAAASRYILLAAVLGLVGGLHWLFLFHDDLMPRTFIPGQGLTPFKIYYEYVLVALNLVTACALWIRMRKPLPFNAAALFGAVCAMALSEFLFTLYADVTDIYNLLGHIYKTISYLFLYCAIFIETIELPYNQLRATRNRLTSTLAAMPDVLFELDLDGRCHGYHSPRTDLLTAPAATLIGKTVSDFLTPDAAKEVMSALLEADAKGQSTGKQFELQRAQGKIWFELSVARKQTGPGQTARFIVLSRDVSERNLALAAVYESGERLRKLIDGLGPAMFVGLMTPDGVLIEANQPLLAAANLQSADVIGKPLNQTYWWSYAEPVQQQVCAAIERASRGVASRYDVQIRVGENQFACIDFSLQPVCDATGKVVFLVPSANVITERKQAEARLRRNEEILRLFVEHSPAAIAMFDLEMKYIVASHRYLVDYGLGVQSLVGRSHYEVFGDIPDRWREIHRRCLAGAIEKADEDTFPRADGRVDWVRWEIHPWYEPDGRIGGIILFSEVITARKQTLVALRESETRLRNVFEQANDGIYIISAENRFLDANARGLEMLGYARDELLQMSVADVLAPHEVQRLAVEMLQMLSGMPLLAEWEYVRKDGSTFTGEASVRLLDNHAYLAIVRDLSERKQAEAELRRLSLAVEQSPNSIVIANIDANIEYVNDAFLKLTGYSRDEVIGKNSRILQSGKTPAATYDDMWAHLSRGETWRGELINKRKDGSEYIELAQITPVRQTDGRISQFLATKENITEARKAEARIERLAHFDQLTGLPNRSLLNDRFNYVHSLAQRSGEPLAVMFLDLDHFKNINDTLGHTIGDELLMEAARRIKATLREEDTVSRQGGDEFMLILHATDAKGAAYVATKLIEVVSQPCQIEHYELTTTASIGIAIYPHDGEDFETLSRNADTAMYRVKQGGRNNFRFYTSEMQAHSARNLQLANALRHALRRNELLLHYQPQLSVQDGRIVGMEALLRWRHSELGMISPAEFIPIAEDSGQIIPIGEWVLRTAVRQLKSWMDKGLPTMVLAVNLSAVQFRQANIVERVTRICDEVNLPHEYLELELTEAVAMGDPQAAIDVMHRLHECGIRMSIDDFGTGYSSLSYLKKFKVYKLKIDQSFVRDITEDPDDKAIVSAIINLASSLGIQTIAEGVESAGQLAFLRLQGCDEVQGYYFSKPLPAEQFEAFVRTTLSR